MRNLAIYLSALSTLHPALGIRHGSSQLRDLEAFPKYEVQFLNHLPVAESDAARCESLGLTGEDEWSGLRVPGEGKKRVGDGSEDIHPEDRLDLIRMALKNPASNETRPYLCLMPSPSTTALQSAQAEIEPIHEEIDPVQSWLALSHLEGKCLYSRQGWFTYAYCHDSYLRQFRAAPHTHPHPPGGYIPEEDPTYDAYTLGQAHPPTRKSHSSLPQAPKHRSPKPPSTPNSIDRPNAKPPIPAVSTGRGSSRYLVQKWSDGTRCDKTGRPRETEVQIHCSMTTNDQIYLIKELAICQYVLIIHSPHLCSLPGFRPEKVDIEAAAIRCRQVMKDEEFDQWSQEREIIDEKPSTRPPGLEANYDTAGAMPTLEEGPSLKELLKQAYERKQANLGETSGDASSVDQVDGEQEVMFISIEEDDQGNTAMVLDTEKLFENLLSGVSAGNDLADQQDRGRAARIPADRPELGEEERALIFQAVRQYLAKKRGGDDVGIKREEGEEEGQQRRDEL